MSILSDFFIADGSTVPNYNGGQDFDAADKCQFRRLTPLQAGQFLAVLRGEQYVDDMLSEFNLLTPEDAEEWTMSVPQETVAKLASIPDDQLPDVAHRFANATSEEPGWPPDEFVPVMHDQGMRYVRGSGAP